MENYRENGKKSPFRRRLTKIITWITGLSLGAIVLIVGGVLIALAIFVRTETFQSGLRDKILQIAKDDWGAEISYDSAKLSIFQLEPTLEFLKVKLKHTGSQAKADVDRVAIKISAFVSIPLLFFRELHITSAEVEGLTYHLTTTRTIERLISSVRPKKTIIPSSFQTSIEKVRLVRVTVDLNLSERDVLKRKTAGEVFVDEVEARLSPEQVRFSGKTRFKQVKWGEWGPFDGDLKLEDGSHNLFRTLLSNLQFSSGTTRVALTGEVRNWADPTLKLKGDVNFKLSDFWKGSLDAQVKSAFAVEGPWKGLLGEGDVKLKDLQVEGQSFNEMSGSWNLEYPKLQFKQLSYRDGLQEINANAELSLDPSTKSRFQIEMKNLVLGKYLGMAGSGLQKWKGDTTGTLKYEGLIAPEMKGDFNLNLSIKDYRIITHSHEREILHVPNIELKADGQLDGITNAAFTPTVRLGDSQWTGKGRWSRDHFDLNWESKFGGASVGELFSEKLTLAGSMRGSLKGPWTKLVMSVDQNLSSFSLNSETLHNLKGQLVLDNQVLFANPLISDELSVTGGVYISTDHNRDDEFSNLRFEGRQLDPLYFLEMFGLATDYTKQIRGRLSFQGVLKGPLHKPIGSGSLNLESWNIGTERAKGRNAKTKWATAQGETFFDSIELSTSRDSEPIRGELSVDRIGIVDLQIEARKIRLQDWAFVFQFASPLQGSVDLDVDYQRTAPSLKSNIKIYDSSLMGATQSDTFIELDWNRDLVELSGSLLGDALVFEGKMTQSNTMRSGELKMKFDNFNMLMPIRNFLNARLELPISGDGLLRVKQEAPRHPHFLSDFLSRPKDFQGRINVQTAYVQKGKTILKRVDAFPINFSSTSTGAVRWSFDHLNLLSDRQMLEAKGYFESPTRFSLQLRGTSDIRLLAFLSDTLARSEGIAEVDGTFDPDGFAGKMEVTEGLLTFANSPIILRNVEASIRGSGSTFNLSRLQGEFREGTLNATGQANVHRGQITSAQMNVKLDNSLIQPQDGISFRASGPINLNLSESEGRIEGRLSITEGLYRRRVDTQLNLIKLFEPEKREFRIISDEESTKPIQLNVHLDTSDPFSIRNNVAEGSASFNLLLGGTVKQPHLKGNINLIRGQFKYANREFDVRSGSIQFVDPTSNIPNYDVRSDTEIGEYRVNLRLLGGPNEQKLIYTSDPALSEKDILSLVQVGLPASAPELQGQGSGRTTGLSGISFVTGQIQQGIENKLSTDLGIRRFYLVPGFYDRTGQTELQLTVGTDLIKNKLEANYSTFLVSGPSGQKVELDLKVTHFMSFVGSWRDADQGVNDFGGDVRFRLEFE